MRHLLKSVFNFLVTNRFTWSILGPLSNLGALAVLVRKSHEDKSRQLPIPDGLQAILDKHSVVNGPFKGMAYKSGKSAGSAFYPKILGCYEQELHGVIEKFCRRKYSQIIDIGCAEGYYAVGLALRISGATVYAYDTDKKARALCAEMATVNGVKGRVVLKSFCSPEEIAAFPFGERVLIICDCEGYESKLFTVQNVSKLTRCDVLIEIHDCIDIHISSYIRNLFQPTHDIQVIKSLDDIEKTRTYNLNETNNLDASVKKRLLEEGRSGIMEWFVCEPKQAK